MQEIQFEILPVTLLEEYLQQIDRSVYSNFKIYRIANYLQKHSSKIEGKDIELDSFIKHKKLTILLHIVMIPHGFLI